VHTTVLCVALHTRLGVPTELQVTVGGVYHLSHLYTGQLRFWVVVACRDAGVLEGHLQRYCVQRGMHAPGPRCAK
jgi:hypothetical protein